MYLVDTNVMSAVSPNRLAPAALVECNRHGRQDQRGESWRFTRRPRGSQDSYRTVLAGRDMRPDLPIIAATARQHALTILSRNVRHFEPLGVPVLDPLSESPPL